MHQQAEHAPPVRDTAARKRKNWVLGIAVTLPVLVVLYVLLLFQPYVGFGAMVLAFIYLATFGRSRAVTSLKRWADANGWSAISSTPPEQVEGVQHAAAYADAALSMKRTKWLRHSRMLTRRCGERGACTFSAARARPADLLPPLQGVFVIFDAGVSAPGMLIVARDGAGPVTVPPPMQEVTMNDAQCGQHWQVHATDPSAAEAMLTAPLMQLLQLTPECAIECGAGLVIIRAMNGAMLEFEQLLEFAQAFAKIAPDALVRRFEFFETTSSAETDTDA